jgi:aminoglycoside phosphotransferase (APT) family kinase protein
MHAGVPAVLMRRMPGHIDASTDRLLAGVEAVAQTLANIHALPCATVPRLQPYRTWHEPAEDVVPPWSRRPEVWRCLIDADRTPLPELPPVLLHRDFHPYNLLWSRGRLVGVTDWVNASCGPPGIDVGHCRLNLAWNVGVDAAERFRAAYERASGRTYQPQFDARSLLDSDMTGTIELQQAHDGGRTDLTPETVAARLDAFAELVASRL